ncbi:MAG: D-glycerate dehydrogenase [Actinobacteria bacterium]|nr:MAG: D-glycerate dehydrogenase [Actinomycetota bacterium]
MRVYVTRAIPQRLCENIAEVGEVQIWDEDVPVPREILLEKAAEATGLLCMLTDEIDSELLDAAPRLRVVSQMAVGVDNIDVPSCHSRGIRVGHTPDVLTESVADHAVALMLAAARRFREGMAEVVEGRWGSWDPWHQLGVDVHGTTLGIVGMGRVGNAVATRAAAFNMDVLYASPRQSGPSSARHVALSELLTASDHVMVAAPLTPETRGLFGVREFRAMKPTATFVNVARGPIVNQAALAEALDAGEIFGAALDVTDPEPLPPEHPLVGLRNCLIVPHIGSATVRTREAMAALATENLIAGLRGGRMPSEIEPTTA